MLAEAPWSVVEDEHALAWRNEPELAPRDLRDGPRVIAETASSLAEEVVLGLEPVDVIDQLAVLTTGP